ncbi:hypothetical protein [Actinacidiphila sp. bgisy145]|uniref:hypothetical protein n=1 Tax=Actinacidiphila sp. bgisy145 TaxID=3413792 RepID=UPI003EBB4FB8
MKDVRVAGAALAALLAMAALTGCGGHPHSKDQSKSTAQQTSSGTTPSASSPSSSAVPVPSLTTSAPIRKADPDTVVRTLAQAKSIVPLTARLPDGWSADRGDFVSTAVAGDDDCSFEPCDGAKFRASGAYEDAGGAHAYSEVQTYDSKQHALAAYAEAAAGGAGEAKHGGSPVGNASQYLTRTADGGTDEVVIFRVGTVVAEVSLEQGSTAAESLLTFANLQAARTQDVLSGDPPSDN